MPATRFLASRPTIAPARTLPVLLAAGLLVAGVLLGARPLPAQELLQPEKAFGAKARAVDPSTVVVRFDIAKGYYLYREKLKFSFEPGAEPPAAIGMPPGKIVEDEFFGRVETFRGRVEARLTLPDPRPGARVQVVVDSQGCADIGVCYPPFRQRFTVAMPAAGKAPGAGKSR